jgi:hypothetical protein
LFTCSVEVPQARATLLSVVGLAVKDVRVTGRAETVTVTIPVVAAKKVLVL